MPQMMPLNWLSMLMMINMLLLALSVMVFNLMIPSPLTKDMPPLNMIMNKWMW